MPFIIVHPERTAAGKVSSYFASTHDVGPTLCRWPGSTGPAGWRGPTCRPLLAGGQPAQPREYHYGGMYNRFFIRTDDWVLIGDNRGRSARYTTSASTRTE